MVLRFPVWIFCLRLAEPKLMYQSIPSAISSPLLPSDKPPSIWRFQKLWSNSPLCGKIIQLKCSTGEGFTERDLCHLLDEFWRFEYYHSNTPRKQQLGVRHMERLVKNAITKFFPITSAEVFCRQSNVRRRSHHVGQIFDSSEITNLVSRKTVGTRLGDVAWSQLGGEGGGWGMRVEGTDAASLHRG